MNRRAYLATVAGASIGGAAVESDGSQRPERANASDAFGSATFGHSA